MTEYVVLVNEKDEQTGLMEKQQAHEAGLLHRAFSVFIFNSEGKTLLQKRAENKYHSPGLWTNTCCSHPRDGETYLEGAQRRLNEEMGFECELQEKFHFIYKAQLDRGLYEHELDHVFTGIYDGEIKINQEEVEDYKWVTMNELIQDVENTPDNYTAWFKIIFKEYLAKLQHEGNNQ